MTFSPRSKSAKVVDNIALKTEFVPSMVTAVHDEKFQSTPRIETFTDDNLKFGRSGPEPSFEDNFFTDDKVLNSSNLRESSNHFDSTTKINIFRMHLSKLDGLLEEEEKRARALIDQRRRNDVVYENTERKESMMDMLKKEEKSYHVRLLKQSNIPEFTGQYDLARKSVTFGNQVSIPRNESSVPQSESFSAQFQQFSRPNNEVMSQGSVCSSIASTIDERIRDSSLGKRITELFGLTELECLIDEDEKQAKATGKEIVHEEFIVDPVFTSHFAPEEMRCLGLVAHNHMKPAIKTFVLANKNLLRKFKLTGTNTTMTMLREVFGNDPTIKYGPTCTSGPLGGDAELVAIMCSKNLGGCVFFQDPMSSHPHAADIECLTRQANVHNVLMMPNPATAYACMETMRIALKEGRAEIIPSFFMSLSSPSVAEYKTRQDKILAKNT